MAAAPEPQISSPAELQVWLEDKPEEWAQQIAARLALRVFPLVFEVIGSPDDPSLTTPQRSFVLQAFRASFISWAAGKYRESEVHGTAIHAGGLVPGEWNESAAYYHAARAVAESAYATYDSLGDHEGSGKADTVDTARYAADAAETAAGAAADIWTSITEDCSWLVENEGDLIGQPLWLNDVRGDPNFIANFPLWARQAFDAFAKSETARTTSWGLIVAWYRNILPNIMGEMPRSLSGERADIRIATRPDEFWTVATERSVHQIMDDIAKIARWTPSETPITGAVNETLDDVLLEATAEVGGPSVRTETELQSDLPEGEEDHLGRADVAFMLANRLQQVWHQQKELSGTDPAPSFVVHIDAPWGGGKSTFANYLIRILNPHCEGRFNETWKDDLPKEQLGFWRDESPWHIVHFNAWQKQHVRPPWWVFYRGLHRETLAAVRQGLFSHDKTRSKTAPGDYMYPFHGVENGLFVLWSWLREMWWRLLVPGNRNWLYATIGAVVAFAIFWRLGWLTVASEKGEYKLGGLVASLIALVALARTTFGAFSKSLIFGTPDAANNYSLGSEDPHQHFKRHYHAFCASLKRPILVIVDDLDRCEPEFVTELLSGFQTVVASSRVIILLLGDKDWLEESFVQSNKAMKGIDVGLEHGFGTRFVEKVIQLSFSLPEMDDATRQFYLTTLLGIARKLDPSKPSIFDDEARSRIDQVVKSTGVEQLESAAFATVEQLSTGKSSTERETLKRYAAREVSLKGSSDVDLETFRRHQLQGLACVLPPNPRQIKRIVNTVTLVAGVALAQFQVLENTTEWRKLARWIVLMTEWPQTWYTLTRHPEIVDHFDLDFENLDASGDPELQWAKVISENDRAMDLIVFKLDGETDWPQDEPITRADIEFMAQIMPATSGSLLPRPKAKKKDEEEE